MAVRVLIKLTSSAFFYLLRLFSPGQKILRKSAAPAKSFSVNHSGFLSHFIQLNNVFLFQAFLFLILAGLVSTMAMPKPSLHFLFDITDPIRRFPERYTYEALKDQLTKPKPYPHHQYPQARSQQQRIPAHLRNPLQH